MQTVENQISLSLSMQICFNNQDQVFLCWGLTTCQPLWVILCHLLEKEERDRRDSRGDEREGQGVKRNRNENEETEENHSLSTLTCYKNSRPCPIANISLTPQWPKIHNTFATPDHPHQDQVICLAEEKWTGHLNLFSMARVKIPPPFLIVSQSDY